MDNDGYNCHGDFGFVCPQCGSHYYHTVGGVSHWDKAEGHCDDQFGKGCKFTWNRATQDKDVRKERCACPKHAHMSNNIMDFRLLEKGEQIQEGDEIFLGTWKIAPPSMIGAHWTTHLHLMRRRATNTGLFTQHANSESH